MEPRQHIPRIARRLGLGDLPDDWRGVDAVLPMLEKIRAEQGIVIIKFDGERTQPNETGPYTVIISGGQLDGHLIRSDTRTLEQALADCLVTYARKFWSYSDS